MPLKKIPFKYSYSANSKKFARLVYDGLLVNLDGTNLQLESIQKIINFNVKIASKLPSLRYNRQVNWNKTTGRRDLYQRLKHYQKCV